MSYLKDKSVSRFLRTVLIAKEKFSHLLLDSDTVNEGSIKSRPLSHRLQSTNPQSTKSYSVSNAGIIQNQANFLSKLTTPKTIVPSMNSSSIMSSNAPKYPNTDSIREKDTRMFSDRDFFSPKSQM